MVEYTMWAVRRETTFASKVSMYVIWIRTTVAIHGKFFFQLQSFILHGLHYRPLRSAIENRHVLMTSLEWRKNAGGDGDQGVCPRVGFPKLDECSQIGTSLRRQYVAHIHS